MSRAGLVLRPGSPVLGQSERTRDAQGDPAGFRVPGNSGNEAERMGSPGAVQRSSAFQRTAAVPSPESHARQSDGCGSDDVLGSLLWVFTALRWSRLPVGIYKCPPSSGLGGDSGGGDDVGAHGARGGRGSARTPAPEAEGRGRPHRLRQRRSKQRNPRSWGTVMLGGCSKGRSPVGGRPRGVVLTCANLGGVCLGSGRVLVDLAHLPSDHSCRGAVEGRPPAPRPGSGSPSRSGPRRPRALGGRPAARAPSSPVGFELRCQGPSSVGTCQGCPQVWVLRTSVHVLESARPFLR